jgi:hypothetical protein
MATVSAVSTSIATARPDAKTYVVPILIAAIYIVGLVDSQKKGELNVYLVAANRMLRGDPIYKPGYDPTSNTESFTYPPFFAFVFIPLALLPQAWQRPAWAMLLSTALVTILWLLQRCVSPGLRAKQNAPVVSTYIFWGLVALLGARHVLAIVEIQSHDALTLLLLMACVYSICQSRNKLAGMYAGLGTACKVTPLLFGPVFLWQRRWTAAACVVLAAMAATLLPDLLTPSRDGKLWVETWYRTFIANVHLGEPADLTDVWPKWNESNQSLPGTIYRLLNSSGDESRDVTAWNVGPHITTVVTLAVELWVFGLMLWAVWPQRAAGHLSNDERRFYWFGQCAVIVTAMPLLSPMSCKCHFGVLLLPISYCLADFLYRRKDFFVGGLLVIVFILGSLSVKGLLGFGLGQHMSAYGTVTWCALALLLAATRTLHLRAQSWAMVPLSAPKST